MLKLVKSLFGGAKKSDRREQTIQLYTPDLLKIKSFGEGLSALSEEQLKAKTDEFRARLKAGETTDDILHEAFAVVKEAAQRLKDARHEYLVVGNPAVWDMVHYDVQLIGGIALHRGGIAEMATGEGKTLVATLALYLNGLTGRGAHLVTVNDYLAQRDMEWMRPVYEYLGLSVGVILNGMDPALRQRNYACDITYGTNNEFGFDYLRDNMVMDPSSLVQRDYHFAIVDEVDSVLIDEARTPLIIAGPVDKSTHKFDELKAPVGRLVKDQLEMTHKLMAEAKELWPKEDADSRYEAGFRLLLVQRSTPKHQDFIDFLKTEGTTRQITKVENDYLREKRMHELDGELYFSIDERNHSIDLQEKGRLRLAEYTGGDEDMFTIPDLSLELVRIEEDTTLDAEGRMRATDELNRMFSDRSERIHNISQLLRAYTLYERDVEYVVQDGKVQIVDEFTGRIMHGRRFSDGLHQALEAKEGVTIERETQTVASVTLQNFYRMYERLAGMTGTAFTEAKEFFEIYKLDVMEIPTNRPIARSDDDDQIYRSKREKYIAVAEKITELYHKGQPVLVGTISVEVSELLSERLRAANVPHNVLNAKQHRREAEVVKNAGQRGAVTIATNMAGRGTDIKLGEGVAELGGLFILGTERHESRRIDLQLRGRSGRQGDPGASIFFLSLEDDLMRLFGSDRMAGVLDKLGLKEGEVISHRMMTSQIEKAQRRVEEQNFSIRKHLLEYDDVMNAQRNTVYTRRRSALMGEDLSEAMDEMIEEVVELITSKHCDPPNAPDEWNWPLLRQDLLRILLVNLPWDEEARRKLTRTDIFDMTLEIARENLKRKAELLGDDLMGRLTRYAMITSIDRRWKEHLAEMDELRAGIGFQAYAQKNPLVEYKKAALDMFEDMLLSTYEDALQLIFRAQLQLRDEDVALNRAASEGRVQAIHQETNLIQSAGALAPETTSREERQVAKQKQEPVRREGPRVGRNDPCPCGSGKKYKACHGKEA
ncbi:MAG: preprotein translocase subunit SecA [Candidatus Cloacimonetes bacterium]|nr:preprotein translocase subunit SecA [Candidatus Cloacimonadota bacterium]